ncbi:MAG: SDR family NAD(P)-dependent oxidoreductase [Rhizobiaceae bacterium]
MNLLGQTILVTGATGAIGQAICQALATDGAQVVIHYERNRDAAGTLLGSIQGRGWSIAADLSNPGGAQKLWDAAVAVGSRITGLVNNAGIRSEITVDAPMAEWQEVWEREMRVNFLSAVDLSKLAIQHFRDNGGGRIINMASRAGQRGYASNAMAYGASKAALINLTKSIAQSYGQEGITSVALAPGWVRTAMADAYVAQHGRAAVVSGIPIGAMAQPSEVGEIIAFVFRPSQASLNGAVLDVNGGSYLR